MFVFGFLSFLARVGRAVAPWFSLRGVLRGCGPFSGGLPAVAAALLWVVLASPLYLFAGFWYLVFVVVRAVFFVRFPRPRFRPSGAPWRLGAWVLVAPSELPALRRACFVWSVRAGVVLRRGRLAGSVVRVWVFVTPSVEGGDKS